MSFAISHDIYLMPFSIRNTILFPRKSQALFYFFRKYFHAFQFNVEEAVNMRLQSRKGFFCQQTIDFASLANIFSFKISCFFWQKLLFMEKHWKCSQPFKFGEGI